jgi:hypothetical protein
MTDTMTSQNIDISSWDTLYIRQRNTIVEQMDRLQDTEVLREV